MVNVDVGGGRSDKTADFLRTLGVDNLVYDPQHCSTTHNEAVLKFLAKGAETATVSNVLNQLREVEDRQEIIEVASFAMIAYFTVDEGDRTGEGRVVEGVWRENRKLYSYVPEIMKSFLNTDIQSLNGQRIIVAW
jgi:hypothetical protein